MQNDAGPERRFDLQRAALGFDCAARDGQAHPRAGDLGSPPMKGLEDVPKVSLRDSGTAVAHVDDDVGAVGLRGNLNLTAVRKLHRIVDEVEDGRANQVGSPRRGTFGLKLTRQASPFSRALTCAVATGSERT